MPVLHRIQGIAEDIDRQDPEVHTAGDGEGGVSSVGDLCKLLDASRLKVGKKDLNAATSEGTTIEGRFDHIANCSKLFCLDVARFIGHRRHPPHLKSSARVFPPIGRAETSMTK